MANRTSTRGTDVPATPAAQLSPTERLSLRRTAATELPVALVLLSLLAILVVPVLTQRRVDRLRAEIAQGVDPALARVSEIETALALEAASRRGYLLTGDQALARSVDASRTRRHRAERDLAARTARLGPRVGAGTRALAARLADVDAHLDSVFARGVSRGAYLAALDEQQSRFDAALAAAARLRAGLTDAGDGRRTEIRSAERVDTGLTLGLVLPALAAALVVARLASGTRSLALRLDESESRYRQIAESLTDFVWLADPGTHAFLYASPAYERIWGRPRAALYDDAEALLEGVHPDDRERARTAFAPRDGAVEFRVVQPGGDVRWVACRTIAVHDEHGRVARVAGIAQDVTAPRAHTQERERLLEGEREAREAAESRRAEVERVTESRARLIRGFTHDVKNPLGAADGYLALLEDGIFGGLEARQHESVRKARRSIRVALDLIGHLLDLARAEAGQLELESRPVDAAMLAREVVDEFAAQAAAKPLHLALEPPPALVIVETDAGRARQVLANLVSNAVKYTPAGGRVTVRVGTRAADDAPGPGEWLALDVDDDGRGIPPGQLDRLFHEFTRFDPQAAQGSGIGLAISQRLARALGGTITVRSTVGRGSTFTLWLPLDGMRGGSSGA